MHSHLDSKCMMNRWLNQTIAHAFEVSPPAYDPRHNPTVRSEEGVISGRDTGLVVTF